MSKSIRLSIIVTALVALVLLPAGSAFARTKPAKPAGVRVQARVLPDTWENDDTTTTAKILPATSFHTFSSSETTADQDWSKVSAVATGQPFLFETQSGPGWFDSELRVYSLLPSGETSLVASDDDSETWQWSYGSTLFWSAPAPGTYYVNAHPLSDDTDQAAQYTMFESSGLARRIAGTDRFATAAAVSKTLWPETDNEWYGTGEGPIGVIIANGYNFPDALAGAAMSAAGQGGKENMPILLVGQNTLPQATAQEFLRLISTNNWDESQMKIYVLGGPSAVSTSVVEAVMNISAMPFRSQDVVRLQGDNRYGTAAAIASATVDIDGIDDTVFLTTGGNFPDGLAVSPLAGAADGPVLYSKMTTVGADTSKWILEHPGITKAVIVGGTSVIDDAVASALATAPYSLEVTRVAGDTRYQTAHELAEFGLANYGMVPSMFLVNGNSFADALAAGTLTGNTDSVIMLTQGDALNDEVWSFYEDHAAEINPEPGNPTGVRPSYAIGGTRVISPETFEDFTNMWQDQL